ncbi:hypothetical protein [Kribbella italica]|uniref:Uncharacterized protein n=1 Tax=Kribbella italica TaxID=1540520 RepID=A0A7W9MXY3_9ACTN|nr:hypothetical protein [Kribbella italica]MBB5840601.1 hypothetical protein [Kribbella italica]
MIEGMAEEPPALTGMIHSAVMIGDSNGAVNNSARRPAVIGLRRYLNCRF